ncbi:MBOAT family O-acyltransferase [Roseovarius sp. ZX-A-9]|uniref:MBOAT family O-acyltransferase n=1 Tax=Roseovarius sp. ZX-A-9 TaxID=3014783 RepID=UPI00232E4168|nr:MBOAT family O-acyltransferase [Roseovarius sp. ZX-A-9]
MGFLSAEFLLGFLPITFAGFALLQRYRQEWSIPFLVTASVLFIALNSMLALAVLLASVIVNRACALAMVRYEGARNEFLLCGIAANIAVLAWFKLHPVPLSGGGSAMLVIGMPLGLSFYAFKQITYLIDRHQNRAQELSGLKYILFSMFFSHLPAGPITPYRVLQPQIETLTGRKFAAGEVSTGIALIVIGAFKLRCFSASIGSLTGPIYSEAAAGTDICLPESVIASSGFLLQLYYNFSGYSDMAIGLALCFGLRLSPNFDSPLKASRIGDYVIRWHASLMAFARDYIFRYMQQGLAQFLPIRAASHRRIAAWAVATCATYILVMLWHEAGWPALLISLLTAIVVIAAGLTRVLNSHRTLHDSRSKKFAGQVLCLTIASITIVFFRSDSLATASAIFSGFVYWGDTSALTSHSSPTREMCAVLSSSASDIAYLAIFLVAGGTALVLPNTMRICRILPSHSEWLTFRPNLRWAVFLGFLAWVAWLFDTPLSGGIIYEGF